MQTVVTKDIDLCANLLLNSELVAFPTETVYGLGAVATDKVAVQKIYEVKNRPQSNPLICHFHSFQQILEYVENVPTYVPYLIEAFSPGPVSYILNIPEDSILRVPGRMADQIFRIPAQSQTLELIKKINLPLAGPSSNLSGRPSHTNPNMVVYELDSKIAAVLDGGESQIGLESTILECKKDNECRILRPGAIGEKELKKVFEKHNLKVTIVPYQDDLKKDIPGNKYPHYSPKTPVVKISLEAFISNFDTLIQANEKVIILGSTQAVDSIKASINEISNVVMVVVGLDLTDYAHNLYHSLQSIDQGNFTKAYLIMEDWGNSSLAEALNNRLSKVGAGYR